MGYKLNIRGSSNWENLLTDTNIEVTDTAGNFTSTSLDGVLDELFNSSGGGSGGLTWSIITTSTSASNGSGYFVDTSGGQITLTLPVSASIGDSVGVVDYNGNFGAANCIIDRNGHKIMGLAEDFIANYNNLGLKLVYVDTTVGWRLVYTSDGNSGSTSTGGGGLTWSVVSVNTTGEDQNGYLFDNSTAAHTLTLPATPTEGMSVGYKDLDGSFSDFNLTVDGNGSNIQGQAADLTVDQDNAFGVLTYADATEGWVLTSASPSTTIQSKPLLHVQDQGVGQVAGSVGDNDRQLNTVLTNDISGASLSANEVTLPAGEYYVSANAYVSDCQEHTLSIAKSDDTTLISGPYGYNNILTASHNSVVGGRITLINSTAIKLVSTISDSNAYNFGRVVSGVRADLKVWKLDAEKEYPRVYQPVNQPVVGAYVTGNIFGGELAYSTTTTVDVSAFSCMSDDLTTELAKASTTNVDLGTPAINTIFHIFAVKYTGGTFGAEYDTDVDGATLPATVAYKRWLGFVRTDGSGNIIAFVMKDNLINFTVAGSVSIGSTYATTFTGRDVSSIIPGNRINAVTIGTVATAATYHRVNLTNTVNYTNSIYTGNGEQFTFPELPYQDIYYFRCSAGTGAPGISSVKLRR